MLKLAVGSALLVTVAQGWALSLGATQGGVIIGRPLDILIQSSIDASEAAAGLCLEAEVLYGENRVQPSAVTAAIHRIGADGAGALRIRSSEPVTEPFVTVVVKAGCQQTFRRSYTLLTELDMPAPAPVAVPRAVVSPVAPPVIPPAARSSSTPLPGVVMPAAPAPRATAPAPAPASAASGGIAEEPQTPVRLSPPAPRPASVTALKSKARPAALLPRAESVAPAAPAAPVAPVPAPSAAATPGSRLKLDPVDVPPTASPAAPAGTETASAPPGTVDPGTAAGASTAEAPNSGDAVSRELEQLRAEQERLRLAMETMNAQLAKAEADRYSNPLVLGLGGAVVALLAGLLVLLRRRGQAQREAAASNSNPWWETSLPPSTESVLPPAEAAPASAPVPAPVMADVNDNVQGLEVSEAGESMFREVPVSALDPELLADLWQRVDFFESLGQHHEAIEALRQYVIELPRSSEAPYLRLLALAAAHGTSEDRHLAQATYEHHFQRLVPAVDPRLPLEDDASALAELVRRWPEPAAREWIEQALASQPGDAGGGLQRRSLQAFDDLLTLWGVLDHLGGLPAVMADWASPPAVPLAPAAGLAAASVAPAAPAQAPDMSLDFDFFKWEPPADGRDEGDAAGPKTN